MQWAVTKRIWLNVEVSIVFLFHSSHSVATLFDFRGILFQVTSYKVIHELVKDTESGWYSCKREKITNHIAAKRT